MLLSSASHVSKNTSLFIMLYPDAVAFSIYIRWFHGILVHLFPDVNVEQCEKYHDMTSNNLCVVVDFTCIFPYDFQ